MERQLVESWRVDFAPGEKTWGLDILRETWRNDSGQEDVFWKYDLPDGVQVLPVTTDGKIVAIKEWQPGVGNYIHLIGETMNKVEVAKLREAFQSQDQLGAEFVAISAARRGLLEETGYTAGKLELLSVILRDSAKSNSTVCMVLATGCVKSGEGERGISVELMDPTEFWDVMRAYFQDNPGRPHGGGNTLSAIALGLSRLGALRVEPIPAPPVGEPTVVVLRGLPLTGKTKLGKVLAEKLGWAFVDVDEIRTAVNGRIVRFGQNPWDNQEIATRESIGMRIAYTLIHEAVRLRVAEGWSTIVAATYSRQANQRFLLRAAKANPKVRLRTIRMRFNDSPEEVQRRINARKAAGEEGGCQSVEHYHTDRDVRHDYTHLPELGPILELNSSELTPEQEVEAALHFITK